MPEFLQIVSALREQMSATLSRSDVLRPLILLLGLSILAVITSITAKADLWITITAFTFFGVIISAYLFAYFFFALKDPDALRSEKYTLNKLALEHGIRGDSQAGLISEQKVPLIDRGQLLEHSEDGQDD